MADAVRTSSASDRKLPNYRFRFVLLILAAAICVVGSFAVGRYSLGIADVVLVFLSSLLSVGESVLNAYDAFLSMFPSFYPLTALAEASSAFFASVLDLFFLILPGPDTWDFATYSVLFNIRLPRIIAAVLVGAALSTAGAAYQGMFQNPLVSPDILGASAGAGFGAALAIYFYLGTGAITIFAFAGGLIAVGVAYLISRLTRGSATLSMVLAGILIASLFSAATAYIKLVADTNDQLPAITYWLMGSLAGATMDDVIFAGIVIAAGLLPLYLLRWRMNVLTLGEDEARSMGINTNLLRLIVIICATLVTAVAVSISGIIGWVGLVIPHFCRMIFGYDYRRIIPAAVIMGAGFLLVVDDFSRTIATTEVPLGILTAFVGAPIFAYLLMMGGKRS
ncbi:MAG: iron ABC transporter permease [Methanocorpusculum sp.]|uniref:Iron ABC transporter permease n=1 Tax=Methanocorpusculum petauri TaxID=3002863 RepID=A0ABT4IDN3_9EURY|nr:iron ABC transporter permease [Methanocorpusculum petauri]MDE2443504.1 iron ABC transporter permease [Methanocorpusculum sp.]MCZ0859852.1 iron ABC transporter permease [Methanocorpusculum petauri]MDE2518277.1 iron ABC transporter permease [Methanocorpusculum sp.]MDE2521762.1 iron ABC transporter permease [Methanocorpusculum sp.]MDE2524770.1 iron ABC transporter permease [Methanocorpusculum sp.]